MGQITDIKAGNRGCSFNDRFQFEAIESVTTDSTSNHGYHCLSNEEDENYLMSTTTENSQLANSDDYTTSPCSNSLAVSSQTSETYSGTLNESKEIDINQYGTIFDWSKSSFLMNMNSRFWGNGVAPPCVYNFIQQDSKNQNYDEKAGIATENCNWLSVIGGDNYCYAGAQTQSQSGTECNNPVNGQPIIPALGPYTEMDSNINCTLHRIQLIFAYAESSTGEDCYTSIQRDSIQYRYQRNLSTKITRDNIKSICRESCNIKLEILEVNEPQSANIITCGEYPDEYEVSDRCEACYNPDENSCWSVWSNTVVQDNLDGAGSTSATIQKWKTRVRKVDLNDEELQEFTVTVQSKYYLQIPIEDSDPIRILVDSGTDTFAGNQGRGSIHSFTNEDFQAQIGEPVYGCINIAKIIRL